MCNMNAKRTKVHYTKFLCHVLIDLGVMMKITSNNMSKSVGWSGSRDDITNILSGRKSPHHKNFINSLISYLSECHKDIYLRYKKDLIKLSKSTS